MIFWIFFLILSLIVEVYLWWKLQASLIFLSGRTCAIGGWLNTFLPHCIYPIYIYTHILYHTFIFLTGTVYVYHLRACLSGIDYTTKKNKPVILELVIVTSTFHFLSPTCIRWSMNGLRAVPRLSVWSSQEVFCVDFKLKLDGLTSRRTILHSCLSSRMLSTVAHRPPEMFWQLSDNATHPLSSELRAAPTARLAQRT